MRRIFFILSIVITCSFQIIHPKIFKKLCKSVTKRLKNATYETVPLVEVIRQSKEKNNQKNKQVDAALRQFQTLIDEFIQKQNYQSIIEQEKTIQTLSVTLLTHFLQTKLNKQKKEEIKLAIEQLNNLKKTIKILKNNQS